MIRHIPNILSSLRIAAAPAIVLVYHLGGDNARFWVAIIYVLASLTDVIDGYIARKFNAISNLGRILDPLGDKLMMLALMGCMAFDRRVPLWLFACLLLKDGLMVLGSAFIHGKFRFEMPPSGILGKAATLILFIEGIAFLLLDIPMQVGNIMALAAICAAFSAFGNYLTVYINLSKKFRNEKKAG